MRRALLLAALAAAPLADPAAAAAEVPEDAGSGWVWQVSPHVWSAGVDGAVSPFRRAPTIPPDLSFGEALDDLRLGGIVNLWGRRGRVVVSADVLHAELTDRGEIPALSGLGPTPGLSARLDGRQTAATLPTGRRALGRLNVVLTDALSASAGCKALAVDCDEDGHVFDATLRGPVLGVTWRF